MATTKNSRRVRRNLKRQIDKASQYQNLTPGRVGATPTLINTGIPGLIYVRIEGSGQVVTAINAIVPSEYNHPVLLARSKTNGKLWEIVASRQAYSFPVNRDLRYHHEQHEHPNPDTTYIRGDQFLPFLVTPISGFTVSINGGVVTLNGVRHLVNNQNLDLTSLVPASGAVWILTEVNSAGAIATVVSAGYDSKEVLTPSNIPLPDTGAWDICAVRLYTGQEGLRRDTINDFVDLRFGRAAGLGAVAINALDDIPDVDAPAPTDGQVLTWDDYANEWIAADQVSGFEAATEKLTVHLNDEVVGFDSEDYDNPVKWAWITVKNWIVAFADLLYAPITKGVTNGDSHDHSGGDGAQIAYSSLSGKPSLYLPFGVYETLNPMSASPSQPYAASADASKTLTLVRWSQAWFVVTTNDGSNYWTIELIQIASNTSIANFNTSAGSVNTWTLNNLTSFSDNLTASDVGLIVKATKTGSPGSIYLGGPVLEYT